MKRIIHMSDLHVGYEQLGDRFRYIISDLISLKGDKPDQYVIVITGDLVDNANDPARYQEVKTGLDSLGNAGFKHILVVPGNHDYGTGNKGDVKFVSLFKKQFLSPHVQYPKRDIIDDIAFFGLDSMAEELHWYDENFAQGELGEKQLQRLQDELGKDEIKNLKKVVYMHHHPFDSFPFHELKDSGALKEVVEGKVDAILYGHNHRGKPAIGKWGISCCFDAGTATGKPRPEWIDWLPGFKVRSAVRVIDLKDNSFYELDLL